MLVKENKQKIVAYIRLKLRLKPNNFGYTHS